MNSAFILKNLKSVHGSQVGPGGPDGFCGPYGPSDQVVRVVRVVRLDDMLSENICFSCPKSSNNWEKLRFHTCTQTHRQWKVGQYSVWTESAILIKPRFWISNKIQLHNLYNTRAAKYWLNSNFKSCLKFNFKILTKPSALSLNKSLALALGSVFSECIENTIPWDSFEQYCPEARDVSEITPQMLGSIVIHYR